MDEIGIETRADQPVVDGPQPVGTFGMIGPHVVLQERRVSDVRGGHGVCFMRTTATGNGGRQRVDAERLRRSDGWSLARARQG